MTITIKPNRSRYYKFTTTDRNAPEVEALRKAVAIANQQGGVHQYVKLQARGHRRGVRRYNQSLPLEFGEYFDVYVYIR